MAPRASERSIEIGNADALMTRIHPLTRDLTPTNPIRIPPIITKKTPTAEYWAYTARTVPGHISTSELAVRLDGYIQEKAAAGDGGLTQAEEMKLLRKYRDRVEARKNTFRYSKEWRGLMNEYGRNRERSPANQLGAENLMAETLMKRQREDLAAENHTIKEEELEDAFCEPIPKQVQVSTDNKSLVEHWYINEETESGTIDHQQGSCYSDEADIPELLRLLPSWPDGELVELDGNRHSEVWTMYQNHLESDVAPAKSVTTATQHRPYASLEVNKKEDLELTLFVASCVAEFHDDLEIN